MNDNPSLATLRQFSVFVFEVKPAVFGWQVREAEGSFTAWRNVKSSEQEYSSWIDAYDAGDEALIAMVPDLYIGPRQNGSQKSAQSRSSKAPVSR